MTNLKIIKPKPKKTRMEIKFVVKEIRGIEFSQDPTKLFCIEIIQENPKDKIVVFSGRGLKEYINIDTDIPKTIEQIAKETGEGKEVTIKASYYWAILKNQFDEDGKPISVKRANLEDVKTWKILNDNEEQISGVG